MLDGDDAGDKCRRDLQGFLGNKAIPFQANKQYVMVRDRFGIEGLFPDSWIKDSYESSPSWFSDYAIDSAGTLSSFNIGDSYKKSFMNALIKRAQSEETLDWADRWVTLLTALESALRSEAIRIYEGEAEVAKLLAFSTHPTPIEAVGGLQELLESPILSAESGAAATQDPQISERDEPSA